jgi:DNA-binding transcriptional ArsR family regulator
MNSKRQDTNKPPKANDQNFNFNFGQLITKHPIRWEIWKVLRFYIELNINQLSQFLKQSRYTVSRHLKLMEMDGMVISREIQPEKRGKYAPKYYKINPRLSGPVIEDADNIDEYMDEFFKPWEPPLDPMERLKFYQNLIREHETGITNYGKSIEGMQFLFDHFKKTISGLNQPDHDNLKAADDFFNRYLAGTKEPYFIGLTFDEDHFKRFKEIHKEYWRQIYLLNIDQLRSPDPKGAYYGLMTVVFPTKSLLKLKKSLFSKKK